MSVNATDMAYPKSAPAYRYTFIFEYIINISKSLINTSVALRNLVQFVQLKNVKREKHPWRSVPFCKVAGYQILKILEQKMDPCNIPV